MQLEGPAPGENPHFGEETTPRPASTVILLRGGSEQLEVLLVRRNPEARFMGGAWVFPGGAVSREEGTGQRAHRIAAVRELEEETGILVEDAGRLIAFARWITPAQIEIRFDTWFYLVPAPPEAEPAVDGSEIVDARWYTPGAALEAGRGGELLLVFPTIKTLEQLARFASADALIEHAGGREVVAIQPRLLRSGETDHIVLPGEPGYA